MPRWIWMALGLFACTAPNVDGTADPASDDGTVDFDTPDSDTDTDGLAHALEASVEQLSDDSWLCIPDGTPPFDTVSYHHGGMGNAVGGDLRGTCEALATQGYLAIAKQRRLTTTLDGHIDDVVDGVELIVGHQYASKHPHRLIGFSRGGMLALQAATLGLGLHRVVVLATADGRGYIDDVLANADQMDDPMLLCGVENDAQAVIESVRGVRDQLEAAGVDLTYIEYPPWTEAVDGHEMFWEVREPYWSDVVAFLE